MTASYPISHSSSGVNLISYLQWLPDVGTMMVNNLVAIRFTLRGNLSRSSNHSLDQPVGRQLWNSILQSVVQISDRSEIYISMLSLLTPLESIFNVISVCSNNEFSLCNLFHMLTDSITCRH